MRINLKASENLYNKHKDSIRENKCYDNMFYLARYGLIDSSHKITFGYYGNPDEGLVRHCFIIRNDEIIDPSPNASKFIKEYRPFKSFKNHSEFVELVKCSPEGEYNNLFGQLAEEKMFFCWAKNNGNICLWDNGKIITMQDYIEATKRIENKKHLDD